MDKTKIASDFKGQFSIGKILAFVVLTLVAGAILFMVKKTPAKTVIDKIPGQ